MSVLRVAVFAFLLAGSGFASAGSIALPSTLDRKPREFWRAVMTKVYGPYDSARKCWIGKTGADTYCMRPHKLDRVTEGGVQKLYVAIGGGPVDANPCHACTGNLGLLIFEKRGADYVLVARNGLYQEMGSWGAVPAEESFRVAEVAQNKHGWVVESGYTAQGYTGGGSDVFALKGGEITSLGYIPTFLDNCGAVMEGKKCDSYAFDLTFQTGPAPFYDVLVQKSPKSDIPPGGSRFDVPFDAKSGKYAVPQALEDLLAM